MDISEKKAQERNVENGSKIHYTEQYKTRMDGDRQWEEQVQ